MVSSRTCIASVLVVWHDDRYSVGVGHQEQLGFWRDPIFDYSMLHLSHSTKLKLAERTPGKDLIKTSCMFWFRTTAACGDMDTKLLIDDFHDC